MLLFISTSRAASVSCPAWQPTGLDQVELQSWGLPEVAFDLKTAYLYACAIEGRKQVGDISTSKEEVAGGPLYMWAFKTSCRAPWELSCSTTIEKQRARENKMEGKTRSVL